ncbi:serine protein kinase [Mytilinidion resinicola]|uniref:non-specific serine/threonine protein kinase n=1 Tax=Mytilinidion resinicola TaxID=574789 RepID=A0A6A6YAM5_9PEZI|nr:serine protein kinase [Mytilinidion resinicola]KAF2805871.1 serine protein kinase [Mytilinidion resinicola]
MPSPPATPPVELPPGRQSWRFKTTGACCEWVELYRPGGFHPVALGDSFCAGKYTVIRKLGDGSFSTVWLAVSTGNCRHSTPRYVALKIMVAKASTTHTELSILNHLSKAAPGHPNAQHVTVLLDIFWHQGPNGKHQCLVFEPMGATAASLVEKLPENKPAMFGKPQRYPKWMAKKILLHALRGLAFLHENSVVHGDVQPGNLLFAINDIKSAKEGKLKQDEATAIPVYRVDRKDDRWAPKNLYLKQPLYDYVDSGPKLRVKLSDLGAAFWLANPPSNTMTPISLRAPELILHQPFGCGIDMWSFGCLVFEILTGRSLFAVMMLGKDQEEQDDADDDHLTQLNDIIQPLPDPIMTAWPRASKWYGPNRQPLAPYSEGEPPYIHDSLQVLFLKNKPDEINDKESAVLCSLMKQILQYGPAKRPSAVDLLKHPWFSE